MLFVLLTALSFRREVFILLRDLLGKITWETVLQRRGGQKNQLIFKAHLLQERSILTCKDSHPVKQWWQETCMNEQEASDKIQTK